MNSLYKRIVTIGMICFTAVLAWIYCVLEYRNEPIYIIGVSLILVISLYALLNAYIGLCMEKENKMHNYIDSTIANTVAKLEHEQDNTDLERLCKAIYVQLRKSNTILMQMMETDNKQSAQSMENYTLLNEKMNKLIADSINKAVKIIVKYSQNNHDGIVSVLSNLSMELERISHEIANLKIDIPAPQETKPVSYTDKSAEEPDMNSSFNEFTETNIAETDVSEADITEVIENTEQAATEVTSDDDNADIIPFPAKETAENDDSNRQLTPDEIAALFASSANTVTDTDDAASKAVEESVLDTDTEPEPTAQVSPVNDDPNRQLTPEEIAALFSSVH